MRKILLILLSVYLQSAVIKAQSREITPSSEANDTVVACTSVQVKPEFPGGEEAMYKFVQHTLKYPKKAKKDKASGMVIIEFIVEKDGTITNVKAVKWSNEDLAKEGERVIKLFPKYIPGTIDGKPVRVKLMFPLRFELQ